LQTSAGLATISKEAGRWFVSVQVVKAKQVKRLDRLAQISDAPLRLEVVVLEDLYVEGMKRNRKLALSINDVGLGEFRRQMTYKTVWPGATLLLADRWFPSTVSCLIGPGHSPQLCREMCEC
jgi:putative transposase